ncbi:MAG: cytochrome c peroxidase [Chloroflexota bacterium]
MKHRTLLLVFAFCIGMVGLGLRQSSAQNSSPTLPRNHYNYANVTLPAHFMAVAVTDLDNTPVDNPITDAGASLGRVLFYDVRLSANDTTSCASCHMQSMGFSDSRQLSVGFNGGQTGRHSTGLANARYYQRGSFFWDERADTLEEQVLMPIQDAVEMGMDLTPLEAKLAATDFYGPLFSAAFGTPDVTSDRISKALAQFVRSMVSYESKYDAGVATGFANFTQEEERGRRLFNGQARCSRCHQTDVHSMDRIHNIGLDLTTVDPGARNGRFKSPSLRNIAIRPPYMHDGRFNTLEEVIDFYDTDVQAHPDLAPPLRNDDGTVRQLNLTDTQKADLLAFLHTLTDNNFLTSHKLSDPFNVPACPTSADVTIRQSGDDIVLEWPNLDTSTTFDIWQQVGEFYFPADNSCADANNCTSTNALTFTHEDFANDPDNNFGYTVIASDCAIQGSSVNRWGKFSFSLEPGT